VAIDDHISRRRPEARHLGVVADLERQRCRRAAVDAGPEQQREALRAHLGVDLLRRNGVDARLDVGERHARVEHEHAGAQVARSRIVVGVCRHGRVRQRHQQHCQKPICSWDT